MNTMTVFRKIRKICDDNEVCRNCPLYRFCNMQFVDISDAELKEIANIIDKYEEEWSKRGVWNKVMSKYAMKLINEAARLERINKFLKSRIEYNEKRLNKIDDELLSLQKEEHNKTWNIQ